MLLNLIYNWIFDSFDARAGRVSSDRSVVGRIIHAMGFEAMLILTSVPILIWWLDLSVGQALLMDLMISSFVVLFNLVFTWAYDVIFPVKQPAIAADKCAI